MLRHTFCSHLAIRGASARAIQELAGHKDLRTSQMYMHLTPAALEDAIRLLDGDEPGVNRGGIVEAAGVELAAGVLTPPVPAPEYPGQPDPLAGQ